MINLAWLQTLFDNGWALDGVLLVFVVEAVALMLCARHLPWLAPVLRGWPTWAAGLGLLLAWRLASAQAPVGWVALCLMSAGLCHAFDLWQRVRRTKAAQTALRGPSIRVAPVLHVHPE
jgi:hypothetical protein